MPKSMEELTSLAGVGRKTANVVLGNAFQLNEGIVVDTHVARLSHRLDLTKETEAEKIESDLMQLVPREDWTLFSHWLIWHGRRRCTALRPDCEGCEVRTLCPSYPIVGPAEKKRKSPPPSRVTGAMARRAASQPRDGSILPAREPKPPPKSQRPVVRRPRSIDGWRWSTAGCLGSQAAGQAPSGSTAADVSPTAHVSHSGGMRSGTRGDSPRPRNQAALDQCQSSTRSTRPRRTGFLCTY